MEIENLFENLKIDLLHTMSTQIMIAQVKKSQNEVDAALAVFCPICRDKHSQKECRVNNIALYYICDLEHSIGHFLEIPKLKVMPKESSEEVQFSYFIRSRKPWKS